MKETIKQYIVEECDKLIKRHYMRVKIQKEFQKRYHKRTGLLATKPSTYLPQLWESVPLFNPFYVRSRADTIAHSISNKIRSFAYEPQPCLIREIPKPGGGTRKISILQIPDSAVSLYLFELLNKRNCHAFSSYCYAYVPDRNAHHAIEHLNNYVRDKQRQFVLEYDFKQYFDNISHKYLLETMKNLLKVSPRERSMIQSFFALKCAKDIESYTAGNFRSSYVGKGVPQGSSISLFLANVACLELDRELELQGAVFARYADDTVILCDDYNKANACANLMLNHRKRCLTPINLKKSSGISLLTEHERAEIECKTEFDFLGHSISQNGLSLSIKTQKRIKRRISKIIFQHLLLHPKRGNLSQTRIRKNGTDWDMVTCINEIRDYLYGGLSEARITECLNNKSEPIKLNRCVLSFYPLVDNPEIFKELDGWLVNVLSRAQKMRRLILLSQFPNYTAYLRDELINGTWYISRIPNETKLPSFFKSWQYVRKCLNIYGIQAFPNPPYSS